MKINIGTSRGGIVAHEINKRFNDITLGDIKKIVLEKWPEGALIHGWAPTHRQGRPAKKK